MSTPWRAPTAASAALAAALGTGAWWAWCAWRRQRRQDGPWFLRGVTILDDLSPSGYREVDVLLGLDGRIDLVCASARRPPGAQVIDGSRKLLLPGFVNAHTHSSQMLGRGLVSPLPLDLWILQMLAVTGAAMEKFDSRAQAAYVAALFCGVECLMSGCTALQDHCFVLSFAEAEAACKAYKDLGLRVFFAPMLNDDKVLYENYVPRSGDAAARNARGERGGLGPEDSWRTEVGASDEAKCRASLALWEECAQKLHDPENGVNIVIGPVSLYSCSAKLLKGATELRKKYQLNGHTHVLESRGQKLEAARRFGANGGSAVSFLESTGFLEVPGTSTSLAHCCWLEESEMQIIVQHHAAVVHNPVSNLRLGSGVCHVRRNLCNDVTVSLGVDGAMSSDGQDMTEAIKLACLLSTLSSVDYRQWLTAKEALKLASEGGYAAMGMQGAGKIEVGCVADVTLWDLTAMSLLPRGDPASLLVLGRPQQGPGQAGSALHSSFVRGRRVVSGGLPLTCNLRRLRETLWRHSEPRATGAAAMDPLARPSAEMQRAAEVEYRGAVGLDGSEGPRQLSSHLALRTIWDYAGACLPSRA